MIRRHAKAAVAAVSLLLPVGMLQAGSTYTHTVTVRNDTGKLANDLHVNLVHPGTGTPIGPAFPTVKYGAGSLSIDMSGSVAGVPNGSSTGVSWESDFASDNLNPATPGNWTSNGTNIGGITLYALALGASFQPLGGGNYAVAITNNSANPIAFTNFAVYTGANAAFFDPADYLANETSGSLVLATASGTLNPGINNLGTFQIANGYSAFSLQVNGDTFAGGATTTPEPLSAVLFATALLVCFAVVRLGRRA